VQVRFVCRCLQCRGPMYEQIDAEGRRWAVCMQCRAQVPLNSGLHLVSEKTRKKL